MDGGIYVARHINGDDEAARGEAFKACRVEARKRLRTEEVALVDESEADGRIATTWRVKTAA